MAQSALRALTQQLMQSGPTPSGMASAQTAIQNAAQRPQPKPMGQQVADVLGGVALPLSTVPVLGDIAGLGADAAMYANYPEERTALNYGMTLAGMLPFVPGAAGIRTASNVSATETPEFKRWFGASAITKTLEPNGKPRRLYHITPGDFDTFNINQPDATDPLGKGSGPVIFMTDDAEEQMAAHQVGGFGDQFKEGANVMPLYASIQNPLFIDNASKAAERNRLSLSRAWPSLYTAEDVAKLKEAGYDGVFAVNDDIPNEIVAFRPDQVKSAIGNTGAFDPRNPAISAGIMGGAVGLSALRQIMPQQEQE